MNRVRAIFRVAKSSVGIESISIAFKAFVFFSRIVCISWRIAGVAIFVAWLTYVVERVFVGAGRTFRAHAGLYKINSVLTRRTNQLLSIIDTGRASIWTALVAVHAVL
jgi:hypothetical protein